MKRISLAVTLALVLAAASASTAWAQSRIRVGVLECRGSSASFVVGSVTDLRCIFRASNGVVHRYVASIQKIGIDLNLPSEVAVSWVVLAPTQRIGPGDLAGNYAGVAANATIGVGLGANALIGGSNNTFALQPLSVQGQTGLGIAAGIAGLALRPAR
jgi:hypothetical protein